MFILSVSSSKALLENARESMAGRCNILKMSPLSFREIIQQYNLIDHLKFMHRQAAKCLSEQST